MLNKVDLATPDKLDTARKISRSLNADARIIETSETRVAMSDILDTAFPGWGKAA